MMAQESPKARRRVSGVVVPHEPRWFQRLGAWLIFYAARAYVMTLRFRRDDRTAEVLASLDGNAIYCLWHNRLILSMEACRVLSRARNKWKGVVALTSASKDGAFLAAILNKFKLQAVRGSSSRRGPQALLELTSWAERGYNLAITPDGPRGPRYIAQPGVMSLAQLTGLPIVPFGFFAHRKIQLKSWDGFQIPWPFTRCDLSFGQPIYVPREATDAQREQIRLELEQALKSISRD